MTSDRRIQVLSIAIAGVIGAAVVWAVWVATRPKVPIALPPAVVTAVDSERADRPRVDSMLKALEATARELGRVQEASARRSESIQRAADVVARHADALARSAASDSNPSAAADAWRLAYEARTAERDSLLSALEADRVALAAADERSARLEAAVRVSETARARADSVVDAVVQSVNRQTCRVPLTFGRIGCPSRRSAALVAGGIGLVAGGIFLR